MYQLVEIGAVIFTLLCIYFTFKNSIHCWWTSIVASILYFILFFHKHIYADMSLQLVFIFQSIWAWWIWNRPKAITKIIKSSFIQNLNYLLVGCVMWCLLVPTLYFLNGNNPPFDALATTFSIMGVYLTGERRIETWHFWISADIISIILFFRSGLFLSCGIYLVCLCMALYGLYAWKQLMNKQ